MQLPLHYWKCTRAKEYRVILAIQSLRRTINGNWLWSGQSWKFRATRGYSQADWATSDRRGLRQTGSLKLKLCLILANNCEIWCRPMPFTSICFVSWFPSYAQSQQVGRMFVFDKHSRGGWGSTNFMPRFLFAHLLTASGSCFRLFVLPCWLMKFVICRYQLFLQVKQDVLQGRLPVAFELAAELGAFVVQCK